jgi:serine/threonine protein kinase
MARKEREKILEARMELEPRERPKKSRSTDQFGGAWIILPVAVLSLVLYSKSQNLVILGFGVLITLLCLGLPQLIDFFRAAATKGMDHEIAIGFQQLREAPVQPSDINPKISADLERVILKALEKNPEERYGSVSEMRLELQKAFGPLAVPDSATRERSIPARGTALTSDQQ